MKAASVSSVEYFLQRPEKLNELKPAQRKSFWDARFWHPVVRMNWDSAIFCKGDGITTYADGSIGIYEPPHRVDKSA